MTAGYAGRAGPDELAAMPIADEPEDASRTDAVDDEARQIMPEPTEAEVSAATRRYVEAVAAEYGIDLTEPPYHRTPKVRLPSSVDERENPSVNGRVRFVSARELVTDEPPDVEYPIRALGAACGSICEIDGKPKASGKTTFLMHALRAMLDGVEFLGQTTIRGPAALLTEQSRPSIAPTLRAHGLIRDELRVLTWPDAFGTPWPEIIEEAVAECERVGARLLVVDTLGQFAGVRGDAENDAGAALEAMAPLQQAAASGLAVIVSRHDRKAGGDVGESGRGSNAWSGAVDCILALRRPLNPARPTIREVEAISRRGDMPTDPFLIELTDIGYVVLGSEQAVAFDDARRGILDALADGEWHIERDMIDALPDAKRTTVRDALGVLLDAGTVERGDRAKVTEPYPYRLTPVVDGPSPSTPSTPLTVDSSSSPSVDAYIASVNGRGDVTRSVRGMSVGEEMELIFGTES